MAQNLRGQQHPGNTFGSGFRDASLSSTVPPALGCAQTREIVGAVAPPQPAPRLSAAHGCARYGRNRPLSGRRLERRGGQYAAVEIAEGGERAPSALWRRPKSSPARALSLQQKYPRTTGPDGNLGRSCKQRAISPITPASGSAVHARAPTRNGPGTTARRCAAATGAIWVPGTSPGHRAPEVLREATDLRRHHRFRPQDVRMSALPDPTGIGRAIAMFGRGVNGKVPVRPRIPCQLGDLCGRTLVCLADGGATRGTVRFGFGVTGANVLGLQTLNSAVRDRRRFRFRPASADKMALSLPALCSCRSAPCPVDGREFAHAVSVPIRDP